MHEQARNAYDSPGLRLVQLYILLVKSRRPYSLTDLARRFGCSRQTVLRMMDQITRVHEVEVESWMERNARYYRAAPQPRPASIALTAETLRDLLLCQDIVSHILPEPLREEIQETLAAAHRERSLRNDACHSRAEPWVKGSIDYTPFQDVLRDLQEAMHGKRLCRITYRPRTNGNTRTWLAAPLRIIAFHEALYIRCRIYHEPERPAGAFRTLAIHRILSLELRREGFQDEPGDDHEPHFGFPFHAPIRVRAAFWNGAASYVAERTWSPGQKLRKRKDGAVELSFTTTSRRETLAWVLSFGPDAELLAPKDLREELQTTIQKTLARYPTGKGPGKQVSIRSKGNVKKPAVTDITAVTTTEKETRQ